ncbi:MAG: hypothetical protein ACHP9Y_01990 [Gammaproteobacteria bacterium]
MEKTGRHKSLDKDLKRSIEWLQSFSYVTKTVIGISECCRHKYSPGSLRWKSDVPGGIKINGYSGKGVTDIFVKVDPIGYREQVKQMLSERFAQ